MLKVSPWQHAFGATCSGFGVKTKVRFWTQARADRDSTHSLKKEISSNKYHIFELNSSKTDILQIIALGDYPRLVGRVVGMTFLYHMVYVVFHKRKKKDENVVLECVIILPNPF